MKALKFLKKYKKSVVGLLSALVLSVGAGVGVGIALNQKSQQSTEIVAEDVETNLTPRNQGNWSDHAAESFAGGSGTEADPYLISTAEQLAYLMVGVNGTSYSSFLNKYYTLTSDIDLLDYYWTPIGDYNTSNNGFYGYFDGDGHKISGMLIDGSFEYAGLFGYVASGEIKNVGIEDSEILINTSGTSYVGGIVGESHSTITNCYNSSAVSCTANSDTTYIGGIAGYSSSGFTNCYNTGLVNVASSSNYIYAGGIAGYSSSMIRNCYNTEKVIAASTMSYPTINAGGIVGYIDNSSVTNCYSVSDVSVSYNESGVSNMKAKLTTNNSVHPMAGGGEFAIIYEGGIVGFNSTTSNCYYDSDVYSGYASGSVNHGTITSSGGISGLTEIMKDPESYGSSSFETYTNDSGVTASATWSNSYPWDFEDTWTIKSWYNKGFPTFSYIDFWEDNAAQSYAGGSGTEADPYLISTAEQLALLANEVNSRTLADLDSETMYPEYKYYKLTNDIDLSGKYWTPIGYDFDFLTFMMMTQGGEVEPTDELFHIFFGEFDGDGYKITGANVDGSFMFAGVFAAVVGAMNFEDGSLIMPSVVKNLGLEDSSIVSDEFLYCGGLIAGAVAAEIDMCYNTTEINVSSMISYSDRWGIEFDSYIGGVVGGMQYTDVTNCYNTGNLTGDAYDDLDVGGVVGGSIAGSVQNSFNTGNITCARTGGHGNKDGEAGGVIGGIQGATVSNCYNTGDVIVSTDCEVSVGGVVGEANSTDHGPFEWELDSDTLYVLPYSISNCYNTGNVSGTSIGSNYNVNAGGVVGLVGSCGSIVDTFAVGEVTATGGQAQFKSGIVGGVEYTTNLTLSNSIYYSKTGKSSRYGDKVINTTNLGSGTGISCTVSVCGYTYDYLGKYFAYIRNFTGINVYMGASGTSSSARYTADDSTSGNFTWSQSWDCNNLWIIDYEVNHFPTFKWYSQDVCWKYVDTSSVASNFSGGSGTQVSPYLISNELDFVKLMKSVNGGGQTNKYFKLTSDIDLSGKLWTPIGNIQSNSAKFQGKFDGDNHKIKGLTLKGHYSYSGLFGYVQNSEIKNLIIENCEIDLGECNGHYIGTLCGYIYNTSPSTVTNIQASGSLRLYEQSYGDNIGYVGGIIGRAAGEMNGLENITNNVSIDFTHRTNFRLGGIIGFGSSLSMSNCVNNAPIKINNTNAYSNSSSIGGLAGNIGDIADCSNNGSISVIYSGYNSNSCYIGGILGQSSTGGKTILDCSNSGSITFDASSSENRTGIYAGGCSGYVYYRPTTNFKNRGNLEVSGNCNIWVGGIFGQASVPTIENGENYGEITSNGSKVGGLVGEFAVNGTMLSEVKNSKNFGNIHVSNGYYCGGIVGYANQSVVENCINFGEIICSTNSKSADKCFGGIVGATLKGQTASSLKYCKNLGEITCEIKATSSTFIGGIAGGVSEILVENCNNVASIYVSSSISATPYIGGLAGRAAQLLSCFNTGNIEFNSNSTTSGEIAGLVAELAYQYSFIKNCFAMCDISSLAPRVPISGLCYACGVSSGYQVTIEKSFFEGTIESTTTYTDYPSVSGFIGNFNCSGYNSSVTDCYEKITINLPNLVNYQNVKPWYGSSTSASSKPSTISDYYYDVTINGQTTSTNYYEYDTNGTFDGETWYYNANLNDGDPILKAHYWIANAEVQDDVKDVFTNKHTITFDTRSATTDGTLSQIVYTDKAMTKIEVPTKTGYVFKGYYSQTNGGGTKYFNGDGTPALATCPLASDTTLYAYWGTSVTFTLDNQGASSAGTTAIYEKPGVGYYTDSALTTQMTGNSSSSGRNPITIPTKSSYIFGGYYTEADGNGEQIINTGGYLTLNAYNNPSLFNDDTTLYAYWFPNGLSYTDGYLKFTSGILNGMAGLLVEKNGTPMGEITIPANYQGFRVLIKNSAFYQCNRLTSVIIQEGVKGIGTNAFKFSVNLTSIILPSSNIDYIKEGTFFDCERLNSIEIPSSIIQIEKNAFSYCYSLTSITIPNSVTNILADAFQDCSKLNTVYIKSGTIYEGLSSASDYGGLINYATTIYVDQSIVDSGLYTAGSYLTSNYTQNGTVIYEGTTYYRYDKN